MIPEKSQGKVLQATVVAVGSGARGKVITLKHSSHGVVVAGILP